MLGALKQLGAKLVAEVKSARAPAPVEPENDGQPDYAIHTPGTHEAIVLPKPRTFDHPPTPDEFRTEARRVALAYARERSGKPQLTWKQAKLLLDRWEKEERAAEREAKRPKPVEDPHTLEMPPAPFSDVSQTNKRFPLVKR